MDAARGTESGEHADATSRRGDLKALPDLINPSTPFARTILIDFAIAVRPQRVAFRDGHGDTLI